MDMDAEAITDAENNKNTARSVGSAEEERGNILIKSALYILDKT